MNLDFLKHIFYSFGMHIVFAALCFTGGFYSFKLHKKSFDSKPLAISTISIKDYELMKVAKLSNTTQVVKSAPTRKRTQESYLKPKQPSPVVKKELNVTENKPSNTNPNSKSLKAVEGNPVQTATKNNPAQNIKEPPKTDSEDILQQTNTSLESKIPQHTHNDRTDEGVSKLETAGGPSIQPKPEAINDSQNSENKKNDAYEDGVDTSTINLNHSQKDDATHNPNSPTKESPPQAKTNNQDEPATNSKPEELQEIFSHHSDLLTGEKNTISIQHFITLKFMKCWEKHQPHLGFVENVEVDIEVQFAQDGTVMSLEEKEPYIQTEQERNLYQVMLEHTRTCIYECSPLKDVPISKYNEWRVVHFHFQNKVS